MFPKKIWTFWDSDELPKTVFNCIETWKITNPDFEINVLNTKNYKKYCKIDILKLKNCCDSPARISDFVRLTVLAENGGIWIDASSICNLSFTKWLDSIVKKNIEFIGYYNGEFTSNMKYPVIESWFFACIKNSPFVKKWRDEFMFSNNFESMEEYIYYLEIEKKVDFQNIVYLDDIVYLAIHASAQKVLQIDKYDMKNMILFKAEETALKYRLFKKGGLRVKKRVERLCKNYDYWAVPPIIKFTGEDRAVLENSDKIRKCIFDNFLKSVFNFK
jgi:hypothetical protein